MTPRFSMFVAGWCTFGCIDALANGRYAWALLDVAFVLSNLYLGGVRIKVKP